MRADARWTLSVLSAGTISLVGTAVLGITAHVAILALVLLVTRAVANHVEIRSTRERLDVLAAIGLAAFAVVVVQAAAEALG